MGVVKRARMAKQSHKEPSRSVVPVMIIGAVIVAALLAFSLRRMANSQKPVAASGTASPATSTGPHAPEGLNQADIDKVPRIKTQELRDLIATNSVTVIDVRDAQSYTNSHIPGSLHIPMARIDGEVPYLPKGKPIVTYCT
jgi:hypothetical protein